MTYAVRRSSRLIETISRGYRIHYVDAGSGPSLVLIPGLPMSVARWRAIGYIDDFARDFRVLAVDPLGHGLSDKPHNAADYLLEDCAMDVLAVLDHAGVDKAHLWGYSRGTFIAVALAAAAPQRVLALIVGGGRLFLQPETDPAMPSRRRNWLERAAALREGGWSRYWTLAGVQERATQAALERGQDPLAVAACLEGVGRSPILSSGFDVTVLSRPPLVYSGSEEGSIAQDRAEAASAGAEFHEIPGRNHSGAFQDIAAVAPIVRAYLSKVRPYR
jgi:pimeloyl-ACP methyl ester carboxylesterase